MRVRACDMVRGTMKQRAGRSPWILTCAAIVATLGAAAPAAAPAFAQDKPRYGGELIFVVPAEPPSFDAHQEETFAMLHPGAT